MKHEPLIHFALQPIPHEVVNAPVCEFITESDGWNWSKFELLLPSSILVQMATVVPPASHLGADRIY